MSGSKFFGYKLTVRKMAVLAAVAAIYVALTLALGDFSYANIQLRVSEALMMLCFYRKSYCVSMVLGCFIANIASVVGIVDMLFGTLATAVAALMIVFVSKVMPRALIKAGMNERTAHILSFITSSLCPVIANGLIIGAELYFVLDLPFVLSAAQVAAGEFLCVTVLGTAVFMCLEKNKAIMRLINNA